jgi:hypothetical protein
MAKNQPFRYPNKDSRQQPGTSHLRWEGYKPDHNKQSFGFKQPSSFAKKKAEQKTPYKGNASHKPLAPATTTPCPTKRALTRKAPTESKDVSPLRRLAHLGDIPTVMHPRYPSGSQHPKHTRLHHKPEEIAANPFAEDEIPGDDLGRRTLHGPPIPNFHPEGLNGDPTYAALRIITPQNLPAPDRHSHFYPFPVKPTQDAISVHPTVPSRPAVQTTRQTPSETVEALTELLQDARDHRELPDTTNTSPNTFHSSSAGHRNGRIGQRLGSRYKKHKSFSVPWRQTQMPLHITAKEPLTVLLALRILKFKQFTSHVYTDCSTTVSLVYKLGSKSSPRLMLISKQLGQLLSRPNLDLTVSRSRSPEHMGRQPISPYV